MMRSMFAGISGLRAHQTLMDVVGNNIANVNTAGFKSSVVTFQEALTEILRSPSGSSDTRGGMNPLQLGLGTRVATIEGTFSQGASQVTGRNTDLAIQGDGFFIVEDGNERFYTRAGAFSFDEAGTLVAPGGRAVMGWMADNAGNLDPNAPIAPIQLPLAQVIDPQLTTLVQVGGNLPADAAVGDQVVTTITVFDSLGNPQELTLTFEKTADNTWSLAGDIGGSAVTLSSSTVTFDAGGELSSPGTVTVSGVTPPGADPLSFDLDFQAGSALVQYGGSASAEAYIQDGSAMGFLRNFAIGSDGSIVGQFSNGWTKVLARVATATFNNPQGLVRAGESNFAASINSGDALVGEPGTGNRGLLTAGVLEMSNVDLAQEFTNMIIAQRGFQANSRIITATDEILADLVNMKR